MIRTDPKSTSGSVLRNNVSLAQAGDDSEKRPQMIFSVIILKISQA